MLPLPRGTARLLLMWPHRGRGRWSLHALNDVGVLGLPIDLLQQLRSGALRRRRTVQPLLEGLRRREGLSGLN